MKRILPLLPLLVAGCGGGSPEPVRNEAQRVTEQIERQAREIEQQAENGTVEIERALENEGAIIFDNRDNLLNEAAEDEEPAPESRR